MLLQCHRPSGVVFPSLNNNKTTAAATTPTYRRPDSAATPPSLSSHNPSNNKMRYNDCTRDARSSLCFVDKFAPGPNQMRHIGSCNHNIRPWACEINFQGVVLLPHAKELTREKMAGQKRRWALFYYQSVAGLLSLPTIMDNPHSVR